jgi:hypothetical protein
MILMGALLFGWLFRRVFRATGAWPIGFLRAGFPAALRSPSG